VYGLSIFTLCVIITYSSHVLMLNPGLEVSHKETKMCDMAVLTVK